MTGFLAGLALTHGGLTAGFDFAAVAPALCYNLTNDKLSNWSLQLQIEQPLLGRQGPALQVMIGYDLFHWPK
ncbi:MAG: hypothetical protein KGR26_11150 [Cyanobacteria bacterium REEB65]|nr:hypothetical protein [Cyanobacteria bacterium REEB65]